MENFSFSFIFFSSFVIILTKGSIISTKQNDIKAINIDGIFHIDYSHLRNVAVTVLKKKK